MDPRNLDSRTDYKRYSELRSPCLEKADNQKPKKRTKGKKNKLTRLERRYSTACLRKDCKELSACLHYAADKIIFAKHKKSLRDFIKLCHDSLEALNASPEYLVPTFHNELKTKFAWQLFGRGIKENQLARNIDGKLVFSFIQTYSF